MTTAIKTKTSPHETTQAAALAYLEAERTYDKLFREWFETLPVLSDDRFWELLERYKFHLKTYVFGYKRHDVGVEHAANELFREATYAHTEIYVTWTMECIRFAKSYRKFKDALEKPLFNIITERGDDGYSDLLDGLVLLGRKTYKKMLAKKLTQEEIYKAIILPGAGDEGIAWFQKFIWRGENYHAGTLEDQAKKWFAIMTQDDAIAAEQNQ